MRDIKFAVRMCAAFVAIVLILAKMQQWDDAETVHVRAVMARNT
ncbi:hypothetical protein PQQ96_23725 [Paraburkholderia sediminicola]